jgi:hypothetical protein
MNVGGSEAPGEADGLSPGVDHLTDSRQAVSHRLVLELAARPSPELVLDEGHELPERIAVALGTVMDAASPIRQRRAGRGPYTAARSTTSEAGSAPSAIAARRLRATST